jgi:cysteine desulfurase / selenocysteine lyase
VDLRQLRSLFPGVEGQVYLDVSLRGLIPAPVHAAAQQHLLERLEGTGRKADFHASVERSRHLLATLIGADADEVAITKNVSEGLNLFASSLPWSAGDNVVFCPELEHPNNVFLWYNLRRLRGIEVRAVQPEDGHLPVHAMATAMDRRTRVVTLPTVSFSPGFRSEVRPVADAAHAHGALVLVDGAQSVGALLTRVDAMGVDALAVATQKALLALYGYGFLYIRRSIAEAMIPAHVARYGVDLGVDAGETARTEGTEWTYAPAARRFDLGNYNYVGARAAEAALDLLLDVGIERIDPHVRGLAARLASGFIELGLPVAGGPPGPHLAHIVAVGRSGGGHHDTVDDPRMNDLHQWLVGHGILHSVRKGVLRFSVGAYNDESDIERTLDLARAWVNRP